MVAEGGVASAVVVEGDPAEHVSAGIGFARPGAPVDIEFAFRRGEERLGKSIDAAGWRAGAERPAVGLTFLNVAVHAS